MPTSQSGWNTDDTSSGFHKKPIQNNIPSTSSWTSDSHPIPVSKEQSSPAGILRQPTRKSKSKMRGGPAHRDWQFSASKKLTHYRKSFKKFIQSGQRRKLGLWILLGLVVLYTIWIYGAVITKLPVLTYEELQEGNFAQTSIITDRSGEVLYRFYEENRKFVDFDEIAPQTINAFIAIEDQSFWKNGGIDLKGVARNILNSIKRVFGIKVRVAGASTITQQLLKNILALDKNEENFYDKVIRKHKEWLLVGKLAEVIRGHIKSEFPRLSSEELSRKEKEKVMELYINFIYLGHQAHGIQAAAQAYFATDANDLSIVQSAALASLPQSPSYYDLYNNPSRVLGKLTIEDMNGNSINSGDNYDKIINDIASTILGDNTIIGKDSNSYQRFLATTVPDHSTIGENIYTIRYNAGRKDAVLTRMYQDGYIDSDDLKKAFVDGIQLKLASGKTTIKAPHFVFWVRDLILNDERFAGLHMTEDQLLQGGYTITTTLESAIQNIAEQSVIDNMPVVYDNGGNNRSMIHIDTHNGDVLAYVGSADYNNNDIDGQVDMIRAKRQAGSIMKAFVYADFFQNIPSALDTPVYDIPFTVGGFTPSNSDGSFEGLLPLRKALPYSRNIAAIKVFLANGGESVLKPFLKNLGLKSLIDNHEYGYSLALGAGEAPMLELAQAFAALSQLGQPGEINPILEIRDKNGVILYEKENKTLTTDMKAGSAKMVRDILSDRSNFPPTWVGLFSVAGLNYAAKSGTSNKVVQQNGRDVSLARDAWLATYTPSRVTLYWAGNANDTPMRNNAFGINLSSNINKEFYGSLLRDGLIQNEVMPSVPLQELTISKITGRIADENTPDEFKVQTESFNAAIPQDLGYTTISVDIACEGKISPLTPAQQRQRVYVFSPISITSYDTQDIINRYAEQNKLLKEGSDSPFARLFTSAPEDYCDDRAVEQSNSVQVSSNLSDGQIVPTKFTIHFEATSSIDNITKVTILANDIVMGNYSYDDLSVSDTKQINTVAIGDADTIELTIVAVTQSGKANSTQVTLKTAGSDTDKPELSQVAISQNSDGNYNIQLHFTDPTSSIAAVTLTLPDSSIQNFSVGQISTSTASLGVISYTVSDNFDNSITGTITMSDYL